jgi:alkylation response protein AidB-like acyl-CoA dehydrogenase
MSDYQAPLKDMQFLIKEVIGLQEVNKMPTFAEVSEDLVDQILEEAGKFAGGVLAPLNRAGDKTGAKWGENGVVTAPGFKEAYAQFVESGWNGLASEAEFGGQGLPTLLACCVDEMWHASNMAFALCPLLTRGATEALVLCGSPALKKKFLHKMIAGEWTGTMNLTEPQAGSDLAAVRSKAVPEGNHFRITGQKIFITYGEHDMAENIVHLVLARTPTAPEGVKGISLFVVPKFLVNDDGSLGERNDVRCVSIEHKLGIHGSPTAVLAFGDKGGAIGYMVGEENRGLEYMFIMMNLARFAVGIQGVGIADRAYQQARAYARERVQGTDIGGSNKERVTIVHHPDVRRMLMTMKSAIEAARALACFDGSKLDQAMHHPDPVERKKAQAWVELLTPVVKGWSTELAVEIASLGVQVHGGMGFIEETGAAQHLRDARITTIYEGTTGIQANDLMGRKLLRDGAQTMTMALQQIQSDLARLSASEATAAITAQLGAALKSLEQATRWVMQNGAAQTKLVFAGAVPYMKLAGTVFGGWMLARSAEVAAARLAAKQGDADFYKTKIVTANFYANNALPLASALAHSVMHGAAPVLELEAAQF